MVAFVAARGAAAAMRALEAEGLAPVRIGTIVADAGARVRFDGRLAL
jgi:hypothetical protein